MKTCGGNGVTNPLTLLNLGIIGTPRIFLAGGGGEKALKFIYIFGVF